jgi:isoleucyl-tRNA synthetase
LQVDYKKSNNILDQWILVKLNLLVKEVTEKMNEYKLAEAARPILDFIDELSTWYVRRSRGRFKGDDLVDKQFALVTLREVLIILSKVMAPFTPFIAENVYQKVSNDKNSVHLQIWPEVQYDLIKEKVLKDMDIVRKVVNIALAIRKEQGISVRQPLNRLLIYDLKLKTEFKQIIAEELNVKNVEVGDGDESLIVKEEGDLKVGLDIQITPELKKEGLVREIVRAINQIRKEQSMTIDDEVIVEYTVSDELLIQVLSEYAEEIKKSVLAKELKLGTGIQEVKIGDKLVLISVIKI